MFYQNRSLWLRRCVVGALASCGWTLSIHPAVHAEGAPQPRVIHALDNYPYHLRNEAWGGANVSLRQWSVYTGATYALTGDIERSGWRLRSTGGYGRYTYRKWRHGPNRRRSERVNVKYAGRKYFSSTLVGYQFQWHRASLKAFGGLSTERQIITPHDPDEAARVMSYGGKAALEAWLALSQGQWLATTVAWASTKNTYKLSLQTGHTIRHDLDFGIEANLDGNNTYRAGRLGGFATWRIGDAGLRIAAGAGIDRTLDTAAYGSVNLFLRY